MLGRKRQHRLRRVLVLDAHFLGGACALRARAGKARVDCARRLHIHEGKYDAPVLLTHAGEGVRRGFEARRALEWQKGEADEVRPTASVLPPHLNVNVSVH